MGAKVEAGLSGSLGGAAKAVLPRIASTAKPSGSRHAQRSGLPLLPLRGDRFKILYASQINCMSPYSMP
ncbi:MAG TPA: hypothetical protein VK477_05870, partial [Acidobacteriota bacterium]|nr:hypothetical protein [Acidobacteriota bacterium]